MVRVKFWVVTPELLLAVMAMGYVPLAPAFGVPLKVPVAALKLMPAASLPFSAISLQGEMADATEPRPRETRHPAGAAVRNPPMRLAEIPGGGRHEVADKVPAVRGEDRFRVELDSLDRRGDVAEAHRERPDSCCYHKFRRQR